MLQESDATLQIIFPIDITVPLSFYICLFKQKDTFFPVVLAFSACDSIIFHPCLAPDISGYANADARSFSLKCSLMPLTFLFLLDFSSTKIDMCENILGFSHSETAPECYQGVIFTGRIAGTRMLAPVPNRPN